MKVYLQLPLALLLTAAIPLRAQQQDSITQHPSPRFNIPADSAAHPFHYTPSENKNFFRSGYTKQLYFPAVLSIAGLLSNSNYKESLKMELVEERNEHLSSFHTPVDNYLQFSPIFIAYGLDAMGVRSRTDIANRTAILIKGELLMTGVVFSLKNLTHQLRPDGSTYNSFPSGHTAQAFAAATFLSEEYKQRFPWMPYAAYGLASSVGALRMANNRHYISDVLLGAGIGILSMKAAYWTHRYHWNKKHQQAATF